MHATVLCIRGERALKLILLEDLRRDLALGVPRGTVAHKDAVPKEVPARIDEERALRGIEQWGEAEREMQ